MKLSVLTRDFLTYLKRDLGRSEKTIASYRRYLNIFLEQTQVTDPAKITKATIGAFEKYLAKPTSTSRGDTVARQAKTRDYYLIAIRSFLKYLTLRGVATLPYQHIVLSNQPSRIPPTRTSSEVERLRQSIDGNTALARRDRAIVELLIATGMRVAELAALTRHDYNLRTNICVIKSKRHGERAIKVTAVAKKALAAYIKTRTDADEALFIQYGKNAHNTGNLKLSPRSIERMLVARSIAAGVAPVTPKAIRQFVAAILLRDGTSYDVVQYQLGHQHAASTDVLSKRIVTEI